MLASCTLCIPFAPSVIPEPSHQPSPQFPGLPPRDPNPSSAQDWPALVPEVQKSSPDPPAGHQRPRLLTPGSRLVVTPSPDAPGAPTPPFLPGRRSPEVASLLPGSAQGTATCAAKQVAGRREEREAAPSPSPAARKWRGVQQVRQLTREEGASSLPRPQPRHPAIPAPPAPPSESPAPRLPTQPPVPPFLYPWRAGRLGHLYIAASLRPRPRKSSKEDRNEDGALPYNKPFGRALTGLGSRTRGGGVSRAESAICPETDCAPQAHSLLWGWRAEV